MTGDWGSAARRPGWTGIALVPAGTRAFEPGPALHLPTGETVRILLVDNSADEPRPYVLEGTPTNRRVAEADLAPLTRATITAAIRRELTTLTAHGPSAAEKDQARGRLEPLRGALRALNPGA